MPVIALRQIAGAFLCIYFTSMVTIYYWAMIVEQCNHATKDTMNINTAALTNRRSSANGGVKLANTDSIIEIENSYDVVTPVHHDDMDVFIQYGLDSFIKYLEDFSASSRIFVVGTTQAIDRIQQEKERRKELSIESLQKHTPLSFVNDWSQVVPVPEYLFPFALEDFKGNGKVTWIFQQLLKLYSYQVLSTFVDTTSGGTSDQLRPIKPHLLVIDSDTVLVRPVRMRTDKGLLIYNIAAVESGAFQNDVNLGGHIIPIIFNHTIPKGFPTTSKGQSFTAITHHMIMDGRIIQQMLSKIQHIHKEPALKVLSRIPLSEWEVYIAYAMSFHRDTIAIRQLPYVNWGRVDDASLKILAKEKDVYYVTKHDDYKSWHICCVNSNWINDHPVKCACCEAKQKGGCERIRINCDILEIRGCKDDYESGMNIMTFENEHN